MSQTTHTSSQGNPTQAELGQFITEIASKGLFGSLILVFVWFGAMKFTAYEAAAIRGLVENSPFMGWIYGFMSEGAVSALIGSTELVIAALLVIGFFVPRFAVAGAAGAVATFLVTLSFFFTTPGVFIPDTGFLAISVVPGQFLLKDIVLLAASLYILGKALSAPSS